MRALQIAKNKKLKEETGTTNGGKSPYGWKRLNKQRSPVLEEQEVMQSILALRFALLSTTRIAEELNRYGMRTRGGELWKAQYVYKVLKQFPQLLKIKNQRVERKKLSWAEARKRKREALSRFKDRNREKVRAEGREYMRRKRAEKQAALALLAI